MIFGSVFWGFPHVFDIYFIHTNDYAGFPSGKQSFGQWLDLKLARACGIRWEEW